MKPITNLQRHLEEIAMSNLERDIKDASMSFSNFLATQKEGLFRTGISVTLIDDNGTKIYPWLSQILEVKPIRDQIIKHCLPEYIDREIKIILKK